MACSTGQLSPLYRGNTRSFTVTITDVDGVAVDITGDTVELTLKEKVTDLVPALVITATLTDPVNGVAQFTITSAQSTALDIRSYALEVTWITAALERYTVLVSRLPVIEPIADPD
jgi:hypothetical protein